MTGLQLSGSFGEIPHVEYEETHQGSGLVYISNRRLPDDKVWVRHVHFRFPNEAHFGTVFDIGGEEVFFRRVYVTRWIVPHDDTSCTFYGWRFFRDRPSGWGPHARRYQLDRFRRSGRTSRLRVQAAHAGGLGSPGGSAPHRHTRPGAPCQHRRRRDPAEATAATGGAEGNAVCVAARIRGRLAGERLAAHQSPLHLCAGYGADRFQESRIGKRTGDAWAMRAAGSTDVLYQADELDDGARREFVVEKTSRAEPGAETAREGEDHGASGRQGWRSSPAEDWVSEKRRPRNSRRRGRPSW